MQKYYFDEKTGKAGCGHLLEIKDINHFLFNPEKEISTETIVNYLKAQMASIWGKLMWGSLTNMQPDKYSKDLTSNGLFSI